MDKRYRFTTHGKCLICGEQTKQRIKSRLEFNETCSVSCGAKLGQKRILENNNNNHPSQSESAKLKRKETNIKKYGHSTPLQQHGVHINRSRRMNDYDVKQKIKNTLVDRYGVTSPLKNNKILNKQKCTTYHKYGVINAMQNLDVKIKNKKSNIFRYKSLVLPNKIQSIQELLNINPLFDIMDYTGTDIEYRWIHKDCGTIFNYVLNKNGSYPRCPKCHTQTYSLPQKIIQDFLSSINIEFITNNRIIISPYEIDIFLPKYNMGIEVNGVYLHQEKLERISLLEKSNLCAQKNIQLLHFWDFEIINKKSIVENLILNKLGLTSKKIYARNCYILEIARQDADIFLNNNHLSGSSNASKYVGLMFNDELVALGTFSKSRFKLDEIELVRFCVKNGLSIPGGLSRIIKFAKQKYGYCDIITYSDSRYSIGASYEKIGRFLYKTPENYFYIKTIKNNTIVISRYSAQKHKLKTLLKIEYDDNLSEYENMAKSGFLKIKDCGNRKFML